MFEYKQCKILMKGIDVFFIIIVWLGIDWLCKKVIIFNDLYSEVRTK